MGDEWREFLPSAQKGAQQQRSGQAGAEHAQAGGSRNGSGKGKPVLVDDPGGPADGASGEQGNARPGEDGQNAVDGALNPVGVAGSEQPSKPIEELSFIQRLRKSAPAKAIQELDRGVGKLAVNFQQAVLPLSDEISATGSTILEVAKRAVGLSSSEAPLGDVYRAERTEQRRIRDEAAADPVSSLAGQGLGLVAPGAAILKPAGTVGRMLLGTGEVVAAGLGASDAELTGENKEIKKALADAGIALGFGAAAGLVGRLKTGKAAEEARARQVAKDVTAEGLAVARRRAVPNDQVAQMVVDTGEKYPAFRKSFTGPRDKLVDEAQKVIDDIAPQVAPVYRQFDEAVGQVPARDILKHVDDRIVELQQKTQTGALRDALGAVREDIVDVTKAVAAAKGDTSPQFGGKKNWGHQDVRDWVTQLLLREQKTMGSLNETERAQIVNDLHDMADDFLRARMETAAAKRPELAKPLESLREANRHLSAAIRVRDVAQNAADRQFHADTAGAKRAGAALATGLGTAGAVVGGSMGAGTGLLGAGIGAATPIVLKGLDRRQTELMGRLARASRQGSKTANVAQRLIDAGVPQRVARAFEISLQQNRNAEREKENANP